MKKKILILIILFNLLSFLFFANTAVFPFRIRSDESKSVQWLGKAISSYISYSFRLNGLESVPIVLIERELSNNGIRFPFNISKALLIRLAWNLKADNLICGNISIVRNNKDEQNSGKILIKTFIIDLKKLKQVKIPIITGFPKDLFKIETELTREIMKFFGKKGKWIPQDHIFEKPVYESFIKAQLVKDPKSRLELLQKIKRSGEMHNDIFNIEMAKAMILTNNNDEALKYLAKTGNNSYLSADKLFLEGILMYYEGRKEEALDRFKKVSKMGYLRPEALNNMGIIQAILHKYEESNNSLLKSIKQKNSKEAYLNFIYLKILSNERENAGKYLVNALNRYPYVKEFLLLLKSFLSDFTLEKEVLRVISKYIPGFNERTGDDQINFQLINPFIPFQSNNTSESDLGKEYNGVDNDPVPEINSLKKELWKNPFDSRKYNEMSKLYKRSRRFYSSLDYAACSLFLRGSKEDFANVLALLKRVGREKDFKTISDKAKLQYPDIIPE